MATNYLMSILVPIRNAGHYLDKKMFELKKIASNDNRVEILISLNNSTDGTTEKFLEYWQETHYNIKYWIQDIEISGGKQIEFLTKKSTGNWVMLSAVDDELILENLTRLLNSLEATVEKYSFLATWEYDSEVHGKERISIGLSEKINSRLQNLIRNLRVSHGVFYSIYRREIISEFNSKYGFDYIGCDWLFNIYLTLYGPLISIDNFHIIFSVNGLSRQKNTFRIQDSSYMSLVFPYWKLSKNIVTLVSFERNITTNLILLLFSIKLLWFNVKRHINKLVHYAKSTFTINE